MSSFWWSSVWCTWAARRCYFGHSGPNWHLSSMADWAGRDFGRHCSVLGAIILALLSVVSPTLQPIAALHASVTTLLWALAAGFIWMALKAGLCEEFLYRAVLQTRLAAVLKSEAGAVVLGALIFSLAHVPGLYLRGKPGVDAYSTDLIQVVSFTIATLSPIAVLFGTLWARTRSLLLTVLLHAAVDVLRNLANFVRSWTGSL